MNRDADEILNELLVMRAQHGDVAALRLLVRRWHPKLLRHARRLTERDDVAADVVQEAWLAIFRGLHRLQDPATFRGWAYRITHHKSVDWIRLQVRERKLDQEVGQLLVSQEAHGLSNESNDVAKLRKAMGQLSADQQLLLRMFYDDQMPLKEIAEVLAVPAGTLKYRLFSLRKRLKQLIERDPT
jgi:RNA polymerase sigma-70 factor (ECF subfamily)